MGIASYDMEITSSIPAAKMFKAVVLEADVLVPKILPEAIKSVEVLEGDGGVGTIKLITFGQGFQLKQKVDSIEVDNLSYSYTIFEGVVLGDKFESISNTLKIEPSADGGSIYKYTTKFITKGDTEMSEEEIKTNKEKAMGMFKAIEAYLLANPDA